MSSIEYLDLCEYSQMNINSKYHLFCFDIIGSKCMSKNERCKASLVMEKLMLRIYSELKNIEIIEGRNILLKEDVVPYEERYKVNRKFGMLFEPFLFADTFGFTVYKGAISIDEVLEIYNRCKSELNVSFEFHTNDLFYETNHYEEGGSLFFRGYAIEIASTLHKDYMQKIKLKKH